MLFDAKGAINPNLSAVCSLLDFTRKVVPQAFGTIKQVTHLNSITSSTNDEKQIKIGLNNSFHNT